MILYGVDCFAHIDNSQLSVFYSSTLAQLQLMLLQLTGLARLTGGSHLAVSWSYHLVSWDLAVLANFLSLGGCGI